MDRTLKMRALLFLYSSANIAGCALALLGPALLFAGVIDSGWLLITTGLYVGGWLLGRRPPALERHIEQSLTVEQTLARLDDLVAGARPHLADEMRASLDSIRSSVAEVLPRLLESGSAANDLFTVRETVLSYLPETLANYVALPPAFRATHVLSEGKTARQLLGDQLALLDAKMKEVVVNVSGSDAKALLANGEFLHARFNRPDFLQA
ncbi:hypothetical protein LNV08_00760 [Paucibacter sp. TC2R-5]|uniref:hypothetical protein n=1 Tax=Paucibacter sp. TC2R-5 TaxID=2893555 RepID=UPI0021E4AA39|nr:hypothetical protein [Paucibacter sp. TC2R-5]MCV2357499.1 hypothetical protein [Paucibacter sp. TC2R-5]